MTKVKLLWSSDYSLSDLNAAFDSEIVSSITDWEDVSDEDLKILKNNIWMVNGILNTPNVGERPLYPLLVVKPDPSTTRPESKLSLSNVLLQVKDHVAKEEARIEAQRKAAEKKKAEREAKKEVKSLAEKKALLEKLKQELGEE